VLKDWSHLPTRPEYGYIAAWPEYELEERKKKKNRY